jgi:hypothetical protein
VCPSAVEADETDCGAEADAGADSTTGSRGAWLRTMKTEIQIPQSATIASTSCRARSAERAGRRLATRSLACLVRARRIAQMGVGADGRGL